MNKLHLYMGCLAIGRTQETNALARNETGMIGPKTLVKLEEDKSFSAKPILKPLTDAIVREYILQAESKNLVRDSIGVLRIMVPIINRLRAEGYDCDRLLETGEAVLDSNYDIKELLK